MDPVDDMHIIHAELRAKDIERVTKFIDVCAILSCFRGVFMQVHAEFTTFHDSAIYLGRLFACPMPPLLADPYMKLYSRCGHSDAHSAGSKK